MPKDDVLAYASVQKARHDSDVVIAQAARRNPNKDLVIGNAGDWNIPNLKIRFSPRLIYVKSFHMRGLVSGCHAGV